MYEPVIGDVVSIKGFPEHRAVVVGFDIEKKMYNILWVMADGNLTGCLIAMQALTKHKPPEEPVVDPQTNALVRDLLQQLELSRSGSMQADKLRVEIAELKTDAQMARTFVSQALELDVVIPPEKSVSWAVEQLTARLSTFKAEANEQIEKLRSAAPY